MPTPQHAMTDLDHLSDDELLRQLARATQALPLPPLALQRAVLAAFQAQAVAAPHSAPTGAAPRLADVARAAAVAAQATLRHIAAVLSFDSWATPAAALGMRSVAAPTRHLLYSAMGRDIDLRIVAQAPRSGDGSADEPGREFALAGQILGPDADVEGVVELSAHSAGLRQAHVTLLDALGEFRINGLRSGEHVLTLRLGSDEIVLPPIQVGDARN